MMKRIAIATWALSTTVFASYSSPIVYHDLYRNKLLSIRGGETASEPDTILGNDTTFANKDVPGAPDMPTLFDLNLSEEIMYDRYAACLAATEGLQRYRNYEISNPSEKKRSLFFGSKPDNDQTEKIANARYIVNSSKVIRALGLSISQFSRLGREVENDPELKNRIKEQAYLYGMMSTVTMPRNAILLTDKPKGNTFTTKEKPTPIKENPTPIKEKPIYASSTKVLGSNKYETFAKTLKEMEYTRQDQIDRLCKAMNIDSLPSNICTNDMMKVLHPKVKAVYEAFPHQAEEIIKQNGLKVDDFNVMLKSMKSNPIFKWKVNQCLKRN